MALTALTCPTCDGHNIEPLPPKAFKAESLNTWYQCHDCHRIWGLPKVPVSPQPQA